jgi:diguanylate cyclase (GGDEF)-like protein
VALVDVDHFKRVNDSCSHEVGDRVLQAVAELLDGMAPPGTDGDDVSFVARMGGEEFLLVLAGSDPAAAEAHLESVRRTVAAHPWAELTGDLPVTVSIGATSAAGLADPTPADLLGRADRRLYEAKRAGRNRVVGDRT